MALKVMFFPSGNTAAFDNGQQVPLLQESWFMLYVQLIASVGFDPTEMEFVMPDASRVEVFTLEDGGFSWRTC